MPALTANQPALASSNKSPPAASHAEPDPLVRRDSRMLEYQSAIPEEDESTETASEPAEPITPTSDSVPQHPFRHDDGVDNTFTTPKYEAPNPLSSKPLPQPTDMDSTPLAKTMSAANGAPTPVTRTKSNLRGAVQQEQAAGPEKPGLGKRVGSFMRNKLHRSTSTKDVPAQQPVQNEKLYVKTGVDGPQEVSAPAITIPKYRRLSTFSITGRNSGRSSHNNSPPSPSSPSSTISDENNSQHEQKSSIGGHKHSSSSTAISAMKGPSIKWAGANKDGRKRPGPFGRRRSASTEMVPKAPADDRTVGLIDTFSKPAAEGVGLKARRLSLSLPDEFIVDSCELMKEFKDTSALPGKRGAKCGLGATAEVRVMCRKGAKDDLVAVKMFRAKDKEEDEEEYIKKIKSEYSIAKSLHHPNIVDTLRLCVHRGRWNHVMEYCNHGELYSLVERKLFGATGEGYYSPADRLCFFKQLLRGVDYLHSHGIAHRDIKLENLLLDKDGHLKISDFGVAEVFSGEHPGLRAAGGECGKNMGEIRLSSPGVCGSMPYIAPEVLEKSGPYDPRRLDVWSCAIAYLTMTVGGSPWQAAKPEYEYYRRFKKGWDEWLETHPDGEIVDGPDGHPKGGPLFSFINPPPLKRLLLKMLHPIPEKRPTIREVLNSTYIKSLECCCPETFEDPKCCFDATKASSKQKKAAATKRYLHHHIPPQPENKVAKAFQHRFDMGEGW